MSDHVLCHHCGSEIRSGLVAYMVNGQRLFADWWHLWTGSIYCDPSKTTKAAVIA